MTSKKRKRKVLGPLEEDVMRHLSAGDLLMSFLLSARSTRSFYRHAREKALARSRYERCVTGLQRKGIASKRGDVVRLTDHGRELLEVLISRKDVDDEVWKGNWWIVMYDIPISHNPFRFELRSILIRSGFRKLQQSVWIHPRASKELEIFLRDHPQIASFVRYMEARPSIHLKSLDDWRKLSAG